METENSTNRVLSAEAENEQSRLAPVSGSLQPERWGWGNCVECTEWDMCSACKEKDNAFMNDMLAECYAEETAYYNEQKRITDRILKAIESIKGKDWVEQLQAYAKNCECHFPFAIVRKPKGQPQICDEDIFGTEWVDQYTGYECDDYYGTLTIQIDEKRYLEMPYHC